MKRRETARAQWRRCWGYKRCQATALPACTCGRCRVERVRTGEVRVATFCPGGNAAINATTARAYRVLFFPAALYLLPAIPG